MWIAFQGDPQVRYSAEAPVNRSPVEVPTLGGKMIYRVHGFKGGSFIIEREQFLHE